MYVCMYVCMTANLGPCSSLYSSNKDDQSTDESNGEIEMNKIDHFLVELPPAHNSVQQKSGTQIKFHSNLPT